jgi:hypothetical protein
MVYYCRETTKPDAAAITGTDAFPCTGNEGGQSLQMRVRGWLTMAYDGIDNEGNMVYKC